MDMEKLTAENAALRAKLQKREDQFETLLNRLDWYQAFLAQQKKADGLQLDYDRVRSELGTLQGVHKREWTNWGITVDRLYEQLTAARAEITSLKSQVQGIMEGRQPATVSEQSTVLRL
jgi:multidrug resistance efflux pump